MPHAQRLFHFERVICRPQNYQSATNGRETPIWKGASSHSHETKHARREFSLVWYVTPGKFIGPDAVQMPVRSKNQLVVRSERRAAINFFRNVTQISKYPGFRVKRDLHLEHQLKCKRSDKYLLEELTSLAHAWCSLGL